MNSKINYNRHQLDNYLKKLQLIGSLSGLFSESNVPLLHYRIPENLYCLYFGAENLSRFDVSVDAKLRNIGVGIKTFIEGNKNTYQKIAEFNSQLNLLINLVDEDMIKKVCELRNRRIKLTMDLYGLDYLIYHCVVRNNKGLFLYEENIYPIEVENIVIDSINLNIIKFHDSRSEYQFNVAKSTLYKRFTTFEYFASIQVTILDNPMEKLNNINIPTEIPQVTEIIVLPLYTYERGSGKKIVAGKSGLNQWNASGRHRNDDEVYIPFPSYIREKNENFFPDRNTPFNVELPNREIISMKVCQENGKAIMSNPNKDLGKWLLRDILNIKVGELVTYESLLEAGIDAIIFEKCSGNYKLNFSRIGFFDEYLRRFLLSDYI